MNPKQITSDTLTRQEHQKVQIRILKKTMRRVRWIAVFAILIELLLILVFDWNVVVQGPLIGTSVSHQYFYAHTALLLISVFVFLTIERKKPTEDRKGLIKGELYLWFFGVSFLSIVGYISGLDQLTNDQIIAFTFMYMVGCILVPMRPSRQLAFLSIPGVVFLVSIMHFQEDPAILTVNVANGLMLMVTMSVVSVMIYRSTYAQLSRELILQKQNEQLYFLAHYDYLTGLYNRRSFEHELETFSQKGREQRQSSGVYALVLMDLDHFKRLNDRYGHHEADKVLVHVSKMLQDQVQEGELVARWGGEEFILFLRGENMKQLQDRVEGLRVKLERTSTEISGQSVYVTGSFGIAQVHSLNTKTNEHYFSEADDAMYQAKEQGRNRVVTYDKTAV